MPIRTDNMVLYPGGSTKSPEWQAIRAYIRARAGGCCEECGIRHLTYGVRMDGKFTDLGMDYDGALVEYDYAKGIAGLMSGIDVSPLVPPMIRIVCTVAHVDHDVTNNHETNLRFWCQLHHNRHDAKHRQENATITRHEKAGQLDLIGRK